MLYVRRPSIPLIYRNVNRHWYAIFRGPIHLAARALRIVSCFRVLYSSRLLISLFDSVVVLCVRQFPYKPSDFQEYRDRVKLPFLLGSCSL